MADTAAIHPPADRLMAYALGRLDGPEMAEIEQHLSSCDLCCEAIEDHPGDALVLKLRARGAPAASVEGESADAPAAGFVVPSPFDVGPALVRRLHDQPTVADPAGLAGLPPELIDHPRYRVVAAIGAGGMGPFTAPSIA
jgi:anti-sigma factor RsiW